MKATRITFNEDALAFLQQAAYEDGQLKVLSAEFYRRFAQNDIVAFCHKNGLYCLPTLELLDRLNSLILTYSPERNAIEIGAGQGAIGRGLGIISTDSMQQADPQMAALYALIKQPPVSYGSNVNKVDANTAVSRIKPDVVIGAWVTHRFNEAEPEREGNMWGIDEKAIVDQVRAYIVVGHDEVHARKPIKDLPHQVIKGDYLFSRSLDTAGNSIFVWESSSRLLR